MSIKKYSFKKPDLTRLRKLGTQVTNPRNFRDCHGRLLDLLKVKVEDEILETLVQFYDPLYHCFTFPDYQLVPTLEEYAFWVGLPVSEGEPFNGFELAPKPAIIAKALHLKPSDIVPPHFTIKNNFQGQTAKFLYQKASDLLKPKRPMPLNLYSPYSYMAFSCFQTWITLLTSMQSKSSSPKTQSLLSLQIPTTPSTIETSKRVELLFVVRLCYTNGFASHLPKSVFSKENTGRALWSQRIIASRASRHCVGPYSH